VSVISTAWLVGEIVLDNDATISINGSDRTVSAGRYMLRDATTAISLLDAVQTAIADVVASSTVRLCEDRLVRIVSGGGALTLTIPTSLQDALGMTGSPAVGTTVAGTSISNLLWSPGWPETPLGNPVHADGYTVTDRVVSVSPTGLTSNVVKHHSQTIANWAWAAVPAARAWTASDAGGEFHRFRTDVLEPGYRFALYSNVDEDSTSSTAVTWPTAKGPYIARDLPDDWYRRAVPATDSVGANIELSAVKTSVIA
jgi:hypothetical protein